MSNESANSTLANFWKSIGCVPLKTALEQPDSAAPDDSPFDRLRQAILELPKDAQHKIYLFLYSLGHRV